MPIKQFTDVGKLGVVRDVDPYDLPEGAWTAAENIRFDDGFIRKFSGHSQKFGAATVAPYYLLPVPGNTISYLMYMGANKVYVTDGTAHTNITRQTTGVDVNYSMLTGLGWTGCVITGLPIITNGIDHPQQWSPVDPLTKLTALKYDGSSTWATKNYKAKVFRTFKSFLVALDITKGVTRYGKMVKWSSPAVSGSLPATWDEADTTADAGETDLSGSSGDVIDCLTLRDTNIIYKEDSTYGMTYTGSNDVFSFPEIFKTSGIMSRNCAAEFFGKHIVLTTDDLIVHDGHSIESVIDKKNKKWLFSNLDYSAYSRSYLVMNYKLSEAWICFPSASGYPNKALVWNYKDNTYGVRELPNSPYITSAAVSSLPALTWDTYTGTWDTITAPSWDSRTYSPADKAIIMASTNIFQCDATNQFNGTSFTAYIERRGLSFGDPTRTKLITRIWPRMTSSGPVTFRISGTYNKNDAITWTDYTFDPSTSQSIDCLVKGRYIGIRIQSSTDIEWSLNSFDVEYEMGGKH